MGQKKLYPWEWFVVLSFLSVLGVLAYLSQMSGEDADDCVKRYQRELEAKETISIHVEGAVERPGTYEWKKGENPSLQEVLRQAGVKEEADLAFLQIHKKLEQDGSFYIPCQRKIWIEVRGKVQNPGKLFVYEKTRVCDLQALLKTDLDADLRLFRKKRYVKEGEIFEIMKKKEVSMGKKRKKREKN